MKKEYLYGVTASISMLIVYFAVLTLSESFEHAITQFASMWYWLAILVAGFGLQVGLYFHVKHYGKNMHNAKMEVTAAGSMSTGSMIACCAHHVADILPIVGLSGALIFLVEYQMLFIYIGIFSNLIGLTMMLDIIKKNGLYSERFNSLMQLDMKQMRNTTLMASLIILPIAFFNMQTSSPTAAKDFAKIIDDQNRVSVEVTPAVSGNGLQFDILLNTHSVDLGFDLAEVSYIESNGRTYTPSSWSGSAPGGHHRSGTLYFENIDTSNGFKLIIENVAEIDRIFEWV